MRSGGGKTFQALLKDINNFRKLVKISMSKMSKELCGHIIVLNMVTVHVK